MAYSYRGSGYLADTVQGTGTAQYLYVKSGYSGSVTYSGYDGFGDRVSVDGGTIEAYQCVAAAILNSPTVSIGRQLFDAYNLRVVAASGTTEGKDCTINELYNLKQ